MSEDTHSSKRQRAANYTQQEKTLLLNIILKYKEVLESKKTDAISWREKENTWNQVANNFNSLSPSGLYRPVSSLKKAYENIKKKTRKDVADENASIKCTGGGKGLFNNDPVLDLALEVINPKTVYGHNNPFDSDGQQKSKSSNRSVTEEDDCGNNLIHESNAQNFNETAQNTEETHIAQIENDDECHIDINWGDYTIENIRQPLNPKLIPKNNNQTETHEQSSSTPRKQSINRNSEKLSWSSRRRPITSSLSSSDIGKKYNELADLKIQLVQKELEIFETQAKIKEDRDNAEYQLKKKCLELDIKIKQAILEKITSSSNPLDFLSYQK